MTETANDSPGEGDTTVNDDAEDRRALAEARESGAFVPWVQVKAELGLE